MVCMTAIHLSSSLLKNKLAIFFFIIPLSISAQKIKLIDSLQLAEPQAVSMDRLGNFYAVTKSGLIKKFSNDNQFENDFSPQKTGVPKLIEAWNPLRLFVFYEGLQEYLFLDRFMTSANRFNVRDITDYAGLVTVSSDNNLWLIDLTEFGLKKYNINFNQVTINTPFDLLLDPEQYDISHMREYQNLLFISDRESGILIFDNLGNYLRKMPYKNVGYFNFHKSIIYFIQEGQFKLVDIYTNESNTYPAPKGCKLSLYNENVVRFFLPQQVQICEMTQ